MVLVNALTPTVGVSPSIVSLAVTIAAGVLAPIVALALIVLLPFSDRPTQALMFTTWALYLALLGVILL